jgi:hypothetical protein
MSCDDLVLNLHPINEFESNSDFFKHYFFYGIALILGLAFSKTIFALISNKS